MYQLFNTDTVLINHRNYSKRAWRYAHNIHELAEDVLVFANYFNKKNIVLYGMCGGAAHMILASNLLQKQNRKHKLIIDRFSQSYLNFFDKKTLLTTISVEKKRGIQINKEINFRYIAKYYLAMPLFLTVGFLIVFIIRLLLIWTKTNVDFAKIVHSLPLEDVLTLQTRTSKSLDQKELQCVDLIVHPANDMRRIIKEKRQALKTSLKDLQRISINIRALFPEVDEMHNIFDNLAFCFRDYLQLFDDEKLVKYVSQPSNTITELHSLHLDQFDTRSRLPIKTYLRGFIFAKNCKTTIDKVSVHSFDDIKMALSLSSANYWNDVTRNYATELIHHFFNELMGNIKEINHLANRAFATNLTDINKPIQALLDSSFYKVLLDISDIQAYKSYASS